VHGHPDYGPPSTGSAEERPSVHDMFTCAWAGLEPAASRVAAAGTLSTVYAAGRELLSDSGPDAAAALLWIHGGAGAGKSVAAGALAVALGAAAVAWVDAHVPVASDPMAVVTTLARQLRATWPGFAPDPALLLHSGGDAGEDGDTPEDMFRRVIAEPLGTVGRGGDVMGRVVLIVIDGVDAAPAAPDDTNPMLDMLCCGALPPCVRLVVTARAPPPPRVAAAFGGRTRVLALSGEAHERDVATVLALSVPAAAADADFMGSLLARARGSVLYAAWLRLGCAPLPADPPADASAVVRACLAAAAAAVPAAALRPLLEVLAAAGASSGPLPVLLAGAAAGMSPEDAAAAAAALTGTPAFTAAGGALRPAHALVYEWLGAPVAAGGGGVSAGAGHARLAAWSRDRMTTPPRAGDGGGGGGARRRCRRADPDDVEDAYAYVWHVRHVLMATPGSAPSAPLPPHVDVDAWLVDALTDVSYIDGALRCGGGAALRATMWELLSARPALRPALLPFARLVLGVSRVWVSDPAAALLPAAAGAYGPAVAEAVRDWCGGVAGRGRDGGAWASSVIATPRLVWPADDAAAVVLRGHSGDVKGLAPTRGGALLCSGSEDGTVRVWGADDGAAVHVLRGHTGKVLAVAVRDESGRVLLASGGGRGDATVRLWTLGGDSGSDGGGDGRGGGWECAHVLHGHTDGITCLAFAPGAGGALASGAADETLRVWDPTSGAVVRVLEGHKGPLRALVYSPDGAWLASAGADRRVRVWPGRGGRGRPEWEWGGPRGDVNGLAWAPDGGCVAAASADAVVRLWVVAARGGGEAVELLGHGAQVCAVAFGPDSELLASGGVDGGVRLWSVARRRCLRVLHAPAGERLLLPAWGGGGGGGHKGGGGGGCVVRGLVFLGRGARVAAACSDGTIVVHDATSAPDLGGAAPPAAGVLASATAASAASAGEVTAACVSRDGRWIVAATADRLVTVADAATGAPRARMVGHWGAVRALALSPDGTRVASGGGPVDHAVRVWAAATGALLRTLSGHSDTVAALAWSGDGRRVASGGGDKSARVWDATAGGAPLASFFEHGGAVTCVAFAPAGVGGGSAVMLMASGGGAADCAVRLWDAGRGGAEVGVIEGTCPVTAVAFSGDGRCLARGGGDGAVTVFGTDGWEPTLVLAAPTGGCGGALVSLCFSRDGRRLLCGHASGALRVSDAASGAAEVAVYLPRAPQNAVWLREGGGGDGGVDVIGVGLLGGGGGQAPAGTRLVVTRGEGGDATVRATQGGGDGAVAGGGCGLCGRGFSCLRRRGACRDCGGAFCGDCAGPLPAGCACHDCGAAAAAAGGRGRRVCAPCRIAHDARAHGGADSVPCAAVW
jgi:WD40 repeat protein